MQRHDVEDLMLGWCQHVAFPTLQIFLASGSFRKRIFIELKEESPSEDSKSKKKTTKFPVPIKRSFLDFEIWVNFNKDMEM